MSRLLLACVPVAGVVAIGCGRAGAGNAPVASRISFIVLASERDLWHSIAQAYRAARGVEVNLVEGPNDTDLRESLYTSALLAGDPSLDLVYMDVTWTAKFAEAGWLAPLDDVLGPGETESLLPAAVAAGRYRGRLYRIPVRTDVGLLFYRRDLLERAGRSPPATFDELRRTARILQSPPGRWGFLWQGEQYEGLTCVFLEVLHGFGGFWVDPETLEVGLDRPEAVAGLTFLRACRLEDPVSPPGVTSLKEDDSRRLFEDGRCVFLRSWPFVWRLAQRTGSPVAGKVGVTAIPHADGFAGGGALGGWGFGISRFSRHPDLAADFIRYAVSLEAQRALCLPSGYAPARADAYRDPELLAANPLLPELLRLQKGVVLRPVIPGYALASDILQRHVSACLAGLAPPERALAEAARETRLMLGARR